MPRYIKKKGKRPIRRRTYKKRRKKIVPYSIPYPKKRRVQFKWSFYDNHVVASSTCSTSQFRINSLYDPNYTGLGDQPRWMDQLLGTNLYRKYTVDSVDYTVQFINKSATNDGLVSVSASTIPTVPTTNTALWKAKEFTSFRVKTLLPLGQKGSRVTLRGRVRNYRVAGRTFAQYRSEENYSAAFNNNPSNPIYLTVQSSDDPNSSTGHDIDVYVTLKFNCLIYDLPSTIPVS